MKDVRDASLRDKLHSDIHEDPPAEVLERVCSETCHVVDDGRENYIMAEKKSTIDNVSDSRKPKISLARQGQRYSPVILPTG